MRVQRCVLAAAVAGSVMVGACATYGTAGAETASMPDGVELVASELGAQTSDATPLAVGDSSMVVVEHGTVVDVPNDPADGLSIDTAGSGVAVTMTPLDDTLGDFDAVPGDPLAVAEGDGYETVAQPLADGDFRLAVTISGPESPHSFAYEMDLPEGTTAVSRSDGGYDFVDSTSTVVGGLGAPWGEDAFGRPVAVTYNVMGNVLTRTVTASDAAAYPVLTNWCIFGKNPNGSCRGSGPAKTVWKIAKCTAAITTLVAAGAGAAYLISQLGGVGMTVKLIMGGALSKAEILAVVGGGAGILSLVDAVMGACR